MCSCRSVNFEVIQYNQLKVWVKHSQNSLNTIKPNFFLLTVFSIRILSFSTFVSFSTFSANFLYEIFTCSKASAEKSISLPPCPYLIEVCISTPCFQLWRNYYRRFILFFNGKRLTGNILWAFKFLNWIIMNLYVNLSSFLND